jgi:hypothetical protein
MFAVTVVLTVAPVLVARMVNVGITAVAVGKLLELLGYRSDKHVTDSAVAAGFGVRRLDG